MGRTILIVNATQVVTSEQNPKGLFSVVNGYPKRFDSESYGEDLGLTMSKAKAEYFNRLGVMYDDTNAARIMKTVTLETADGRQLMHESIGGFVDIEPEPEPEEPEEASE